MVAVALELRVAVGVTLPFGVVVVFAAVAPVIRVALVAGPGVAVFCVAVVTLTGVELATTMLDVVVAPDAAATDVADDAGAGVGVDEADTLDTAVTTAI